MFFKFDIFNNQQRLLGSSAVSLDWRSNVWLLTDDKNGVWKRIAEAKSGKFELQKWGVLWMWDKMDKIRNIAIVWDTPKSGTDFSSLKGSARLFQPVDSSLKDCIIKWTLDLGKTSKAIAIYNSPLPFARSAYIQRLNWLMPAPYMSLNYDIIAHSLRKGDKGVTEGYTTCGSLPGFIGRQVASSKGLKGHAFDNWVNKYGLEGTFKVRDMANQLGCWKESKPNGEPPKPGDIYCLLDRGKTDKKVDGISHVGVIEDASGKNWKTIDLGQHGGFDGDKNNREYKPGTCELWGENNQGGGYRTVAGWLDLEGYFRAG
jgi:hypothetical protein